MHKYFSSVAFFVVIIICPLLASAHQFKYGSMYATIDATTTPPTVTFSMPEELPTNVIGGFTIDAWNEYLFSRFLVVNDNGLCAFHVTAVTPLEKTTEVAGNLECPEKIITLDTLFIRLTAFSDFYEDYTIFTTVKTQSDTSELRFNKHAIEFPKDIVREGVFSVSRFIRVVAEFMRGGMTHIWSGYDHVLFLLTILLLSTTLARTLAMVTMFTLAHSITLILAGMQVVQLDSKIVEPVIALTIIAVATWNLLVILGHKVEESYWMRLMVIFLFGLVHGLGFAGALSETPVPQDFFYTALISFNGGVELGQLALLLVLVPLLKYTRGTQHSRHILIGISLITICISAFWTFERLFF